MNNTFNPSPSDFEFFQWLESERGFGINYLVKNFAAFSYYDAEDIFNDVCLGQANAGEKRAKLMERGVLVERLRWRAMELRRSAATVRHGNGFEMVEISEVEDWLLRDETDMLAELEEESERELLASVISDILPDCNRRQALFVEVVASVISTRASCHHWSEAFSPAQREAFMTNFQGGLNDSEGTFRREVNRACRQVTAKLVRLIQRKTVPLAN